MTMTEESSLSFHRNFSEWWSEETEYVFQRIERWAAYARGYNRLRSQRLSSGRMTMHKDERSTWSISSSNKMVIDDTSWSPRFQDLKRSHDQRSPREETRLNCCGTFDYKSNGNLDSNCLDTYRYDHSIYFKTIGEIRNSKRDDHHKDFDVEASNSEDENVEFEQEFEDLTYPIDFEGDRDPNRGLGNSQINRSGTDERFDGENANFSSIWADRENFAREEEEFVDIFEDRAFRNDDNNNVIVDEEWKDFESSETNSNLTKESDKSKSTVDLEGRSSSVKVCQPSSRGNDVWPALLQLEEDGNFALVSPHHHAVDARKELLAGF